MRAITGVGIGGMLASVGVITAEYSSNKWRSTAIALQATGYPIGATIGGTIAAVLLASYGWRSVFIFGGLATAVMIPVVLWRLPESVDFLIARRPANALQKLNVLLQEDAAACTDAVAGAAGARSERRQVEQLLGPVRAGHGAIDDADLERVLPADVQLLLRPQLDAEAAGAAGLSAQQGITGGVLLNVGGIVGGSLFGLLAARLDLGWLTGCEPCC